MKTSFGGMKRKHWCLTEQTKVNIDLLKNALQNRCHIQGHLYDMSVKLHKLKQGSSLEAYINNPDNLARHLQLPEQQKIHYFIFGLKPKLKQTLLIRQPQTYNNTDSDTQLMDLLQEIQKEVSLKAYWNQTWTIFSACSRWKYELTSARHSTTPIRYANSQGISYHIHTSTRYSFGHQSYYIFKLLLGPILPPTLDVTWLWKIKGVPAPHKKPQWNSMSASQFPVLSRPFLYLPFLDRSNNVSLCTYPFFVFVFYTYII